MIKTIENNKKSQSNIKLIKIETKNSLYTTPYENVVKVLNAIRDYIFSINHKNNNRALDELDWVINIIANNLLYYYQKTKFYTKNIDIINGSHKIAEFSEEVEKYNKEYEDFCKKYSKIGIKNEEYSKSLSFFEKNISLINNKKNISNISLNYEPKIKSIGIIGNQKKITNNIISQFPIHLLNDYNKLTNDNSINNINSTDFNEVKNKRNLNFNSIISNRKNKAKELSIDSQSSSKNDLLNKNSLFNNYRIYSTANTNIKNKPNESFPRQRKKNRVFGEHNYINNNNNQQLEKIISLPIIQFNFNGGINIDKYKINLFNKKNNYNIKNKRTDKVQSFKKLVTFGKEINYKIPKLPIYLTSGIDIDSLFDFQNFNIFNLRDKIGLENVMPFLGKEIIKKINILHFFDEQKLENFLMVLSKTYQNTRALYHTSLHGVDVCYSTFLILTFLRNEENKIKDISDIDIVSLIIAALAHDVGHPGYTNKFLINSKNELSTIYNDASVLENFHSAKTFQLLENNEINIFSNFSNEDFLLIRKKMIGEILSTDMSFHFKIVNEYKEYKKNKDKVLEQNQLNFITHIADLFHNYRKYEISLRWVELLSNEFWNQGDKERELGLPISFLCDREDINVPKSQVDFIHTFSLPTIQELVDVNIKFEVLKNNVINNLNMWDKLQKEKRKRGWTPKKSDKNTL